MDGEGRLDKLWHLVKRQSIGFFIPIETTTVLYDLERSNMAADP